jgi:MFS family permease
LITWLACAVTVLAAYSAGEYAPAAEQLLPVWNVSTVAFDTGITVFTTGFAIAPMVLAPFSEINGRRPVFIASGILFTGKREAGFSEQWHRESADRAFLVVCLIGCGGTNSFAGMLVARFFQGVGGCMCPDDLTFM